MSLSSRDKKLLWHPFTQEKTAELPIVITKATGSYLYDDQGQTYLDLISSWWTNLHGHAHPTIAQAIFDQAMSLFSKSRPTYPSLRTNYLFTSSLLHFT